jgi:toxin YoeB
MVKKKVIWTSKGYSQLFSIMDYYTERNKSDFYSLKLENEIKQKLSELDYLVALPKKTSLENVYYFTHKHICVLFLLKSIV